MDFTSTMSLMNDVYRHMVEEKPVIVAVAAKNII